MADICCGVVSEEETSKHSDSTTRAARRRRMEIRRIKFVAGVAPADTGKGLKRRRLECNPAPCSRECENAFDYCALDGGEQTSLETANSIITETEEEASLSGQPLILLTPVPLSDSIVFPKFGVASVCGRRRDMEDAVAIQPNFCRRDTFNTASELHYFGVYDGHGCSHVATKCKDRLHELVKEELERKVESTGWTKAMERSFNRMDSEVISWNASVVGANCRCELQTPECDAVGSTAVVAIVMPSKIVVANCGDSRAVLCRKGKAVPLSVDHKPDRPDELNRIQAVGGRVIYWDGPRVLGVLAMSRAIGDNYLKPYVSCDPEVTITERGSDDDCLILASDGLWDVVSNDTACSVARMCLKGKAPSQYSPSEGDGDGGTDNSDRACLDAAMLLTKLALARRSNDNVSVVVIDLRKDT